MTKAGPRHGRRLSAHARLQRQPVRRRRQPAQGHRRSDARPDHLDLHMPEEDGLSIIRDLKRRASVPIIMLTATASAIDRVVGLEMGADDYIAKPCELRELLARVRVVLRRSTAAPQPVTGAEPATAPAKSTLVRFGTKWLDHDAQSLRDNDGNEHQLTASEYGLLRSSPRTPSACCRATACWTWRLAEGPSRSTGRSTCESCGCGGKSSPIPPTRRSSGPSGAGVMYSLLAGRRPEPIVSWPQARRNNCGILIPIISSRAGRRNNKSLGRNHFSSST